MSRLHCAAALSAIIAGIIHIAGAQAMGVRVGDTVQIVHDVAGRQSDDQAWGSKSEGDDVYESETIRSAVESQARIVLIDRTGLAVGPITNIRVDRVLRNSDQSIKGIVVSAGNGTLRWTSGDSTLYLIKTPTATVTPMGTVFDLFVDFQRTFVILRQGRVKVCTNNPPETCRILANAGEMMLATADDLQGPGRGGLEPADFANRCLSATGQNCVMRLTDNPPSPREPSPPKTKRAAVQPSRPPAVEEEPPPPPRRVVDLPRRPRPIEPYVVPGRFTYPAYYRRPYLRPVYTTAGAGYTAYPRRPMMRPIMMNRPMYPSRPMYTPRPG